MIGLRGFFLCCDTMDLLNEFLKTKSVSIDTRTLKKGDLFFALKGDQFDGNQFITTALEKGASLCITDDPLQVKNDRVYLVENVLASLQNLATRYRDLFRGRVLAITGSNGKTTTKELINCILKSAFNTRATSGNLNNHIGVPLTLLSTPEETELVIVEIGANHEGEINLLCKMAKPDLGIITNCGKAHLEGFGSVEGVIRAKTELYRYLDDHLGTVFYNQNDPVLVKHLPVRTVNIPYLKYKTIRTQPNIELQVEGKSYKSSLYGNYNAVNIISALTIGQYFEIHPDELANAIESYIPDNNRSQIIHFKDANVFMDAYNANPTSIEASLHYFADAPYIKKMVILGDMLELGDYSKDEHQKIVQILENMDLEHVILVGELFKRAKSNFPVFESVQKAKEYFDLLDIQGWAIYIKGSRGIRLEKLLDQ